MSKRAIEWAQTVRIGNGPMRQVLSALAYMHHDSRKLFPSQALLAEKTGLSERAVRYALQLLSHFGIVQRTGRSNGARGRTSDLVVLSFGFHSIEREQVTAAKKALLKPRCNRHRVPLAISNSQPAPHAGPPGTACQGIGELVEEPNQGSTELSIGHCTREADGDRPTLRLLVGGRS